MADNDNIEIEAHHRLGQRLALDLIKTQDGCGSAMPATVAVGLLLAFLPRNETPEGQEAFRELINFTLRQAKAPWRLVATKGDDGDADALVVAKDD